MGCLHERAKPGYGDRLLEPGSTVYLTNMTVSHWVMKILINVFLSLPPLIQAGLKKNIDENYFKNP